VKPPSDTLLRNYNNNKDNVFRPIKASSGEYWVVFKKKLFVQVFTLLMMEINCAKYIDFIIFAFYSEE
jgi:hypothetical protein